VDGGPKLRLLVVTAMYPRPGNQSSGAFVEQQVEQLQAMGHKVETVDFPGYRSKLEYAKAALAVRRRTRLGATLRPQNRGIRLSERGLLRARYRHDA
jgi:hypothetical protein